MGGENNLYVRIKLQNKVDKLFLPFDVHTYFRFVHKENIRALIFNQHCKQHHQQLLFSTRQLIRLQRFAYLRKAHFVLAANNSLARFGKQAVNHVLKQSLGLVVRLRQACSVWGATLQSANNAVANINLIV